MTNATWDSNTYINSGASDMWQMLIPAAAPLVGGLISNRNNRKIAASQTAAQYDFAQQGIRWRTEDAKAAGLHPLYALGAQTPTYSPTHYSDSMGPAIAGAGQAVAEGYARKQDQQNIQAQMRAQKLENAEMRLLERERLQTDIIRLRSQMNTDAAMANYYNAMAGKARSDTPAHNDLPTTNSPVDTGQFIVKPREVPTTEKGNPTVAAGKTPAWMRVPFFNGWGKSQWGKFTIWAPYNSQGEWAEDLEVPKALLLLAVNYAAMMGWNLELTHDAVMSMADKAMKSETGKRLYEFFKEPLIKKLKPSKRPDYRSISELGPMP